MRDRSFTQRRRFAGVSRAALSLSQRLAGGMTLATLMFGIGQPVGAQTLPNGGTITAGSGSITTGARSVEVNQTSDRMVVAWQGFDIGAGERVTFNQPNASSVALNRVLTGGASRIDGSLIANGQVWLLNPNGVVIGRDAVVNTAGLVLSSLGLSDDDFMGGRNSFSGNGTGAIVNHGRLTTGAGGVVALIGPAVANSGTIDTPGGSTVMAAGSAVALDFTGDGLITYRVDRGALDAQVANSGAITADGGMVVLTARGADALTASSVNTTGTIRASSLVSRGGRVLLDGDTAAGTTNVAGAIDVSSTTGQGGLATITGGNIVLTGATIDASGAAGGGTINVGGGRYGQDATVANATTLMVDAASTLRADAIDRGNGGFVTAWSNGTTGFAGRIAARGGRLGGNGGELEVSGKIDLRYAGIADALAPMGLTGNLLLDPTNITIMGGSGTSGNWTSGTGDVTIYATTLEAQSANVLLQATRYITFMDLNDNGGDGDIVMQRDVSFRAEALNTLSGTANNRRASIVFTNASNTLKVSGTGSIYMNGGGSGNGYGTIGDRPDSASTVITPGTGTFNLIAGDVGDVGSNPVMTALPNHNVGTVGSVTPGAGSITLLGADGILVSGNITTEGGYVRISGDSDIGGGGSINLSKDITTNGGNLYVYFGNAGSAENVATIGGHVQLGSGRLIFGDEVNAANVAAGLSRVNLGQSTGVKRLGGLLELSNDVNFTTPLTLLGGATIHTDGDINFSSTVNFDTGTDALTLRANNISFANATLANVSTASIVLEPWVAATDINLDGLDGIVPANSFTKLAGIKNLTIGRVDGTGTTIVSNAGFAFGASGRLTLLNGAMQIDGLLQNTSATGTILARAGSTDVTINAGGSIRALGSGDAVIATAARNFVNHSGTGALVAPNAAGRWLTYSTNPADDLRSGLAVAFKQYDATYGTTTVAQATGNGHLYSTAPVVQVALVGSTGKVYDGTTAASLTLASNFAVSGAIDGDDISGFLTGFANATYDTRNVGTAKTVTATGLTGGTAIDGAVTVYGYGVTSTASAAIGTITRKVVAASLSATDKVYDGTTAATGSATLTSGVIAGDTLGVGVGGSSFDTRDAGAGKTVTLTGLTLTGNDAGNYQLAATSGTTTAAISRKVVAASLSATDKVYDGTIAATGSATLTSGVIAGDTLGVGVGGSSFDTRDAGAGKTVTLTGLTLTGNDAGNYQLAATSGTTTAAILARTLSVSITALDKVYDGTTVAILRDPVIQGIVPGDRIRATADAAFETATPGIAKPVLVTGITLRGEDSGNYRLTAASLITSATVSPVETSAPITAALISGNETAKDAIDAGNAKATVSANFNTSSAPLVTAMDRAATISAGSDVLTLSRRTIIDTGRTSLLTSDAAIEPIRNNLSIYTAKAASEVAFEGTFAATDRGNLVTLQTALDSSSIPVTLDNPSNTVRATLPVADGTLDLTIGTNAPDVLVVDLNGAVQRPSVEEVAGYALYVARKRLNLSLDQFRAVVIRD